MESASPGTTRSVRGLFLGRRATLGSGEDYDYTASYAWFDAGGNLQVEHLKGGYDALHAAYGRGQRSIVVDADADLGPDVELVILQSPATGEHIPYKALQAEPSSPRARAAKSGRVRLVAFPVRGQRNFYTGAGDSKEVT